MTARATAVAGGLRGAFLLAWGRPEGLLRVRVDRAGVVASFWAAAICLPMFALLRWLDWRADIPANWPARPAHAAALDALVYVTGWAGYALASRPLAQALGVERRWPRFIAAWNWCNVVQYLLLLAAAVPDIAGAPDWLGETSGLFALFWALWLEWYVTRLALEIPRLPAAAFVALDVGLGILLTAVTSLLQ